MHIAPTFSTRFELQRFHEGFIPTLFFLFFLLLVSHLLHTLEHSSDKNMVRQSDDSPPLLVGGYPFYRRQRTAEMARVLDDAITLVKSIPEVSQDLVVALPVGSGAIKGMPGPAQTDLLLCMTSYPPTDEQIDALARRGINSKGISPHHAEDTWFRNEVLPEEDGGVPPVANRFGVRQTFEPGHLGSVNFHWVSPSTSNSSNQFIADMLSFADYLCSNEQAFQRYKQVKLEGAELAAVGAGAGAAVAGPAEGAPEGPAEGATGGAPEGPAEGAPAEAGGAAAGADTEVGRRQAESKRLIGYKVHKSAVALELMEEARKWRREGNWNVPQELRDILSREVE